MFPSTPAFAMNTGPPAAAPVGTSVSPIAAIEAASNVSARRSGIRRPVADLRAISMVCLSVCFNLA